MESYLKDNFLSNNNTNNKEKISYKNKKKDIYDLEYSFVEQKYHQKPPRISRIVGTIFL